ncbi:MAG: JAB domain-containing protein [Bdellovibrionia bacterium]
MEVTNSRTAHELLRPFLLGNEVEEFWAIALGSTKRVIRIQMIFRGTVDACLVHPRDVFRFALTMNASSLLVAHNHPSGDNRPSQEDLALTKRLADAGKLLQIPLIDHLILADDGFFSLADRGLLR